MGYGLLQCPISKIWVRIRNRDLAHHGPDIPLHPIQHGHVTYLSVLKWKTGYGLRVTVMSHVQDLGQNTKLGFGTS